MSFPVLTRSSLSPTPASAITCGMVAAAMVLGGGGSSAPASELILEVVIALAAAAWLLVRRGGEYRWSRGAALLAALLLVLPVLQLVPLPPALWRALPAHAPVTAGLDLVNAGGSWMPWSLSPARTGASLLATIPVAFVLLAASGLDGGGRRALLATVAMVGFASLLLGALQLSDGSGRTWRFYADNPGYLNGFQANRNAEADVLLIALAAFAGVAWQAGGDRAMAAGRAALAIAGAALLLLGCVLTGSRAGIAIAAPIAVLLLLRGPARFVRRPGVPVLAAALALIAGAIVLTQAPGSALHQVAERFTWQRDVRADLWRDTMPALRSAWPTGSGIGTFRPMFVAGEPLTAVDPTRPVRAHNDYLEFALEGGVAAVVLIIAIVGVVGSRLVRAFRAAPARDKPSVTFAAATCLIIALHSLVDYPMRSMALATLGAAATGLLFAVTRDAARHRRARDPGLEASQG